MKLDLIFSNIRNVHEEVKQHLSLNTESYAVSTNVRRKDRQYDIGAIVLNHLKPEHFHLGGFTKLYARCAGTFLNA